MAVAVDVYTESAATRAFAGGTEWPGWCRSGRREDDALETLLAYAPRYAGVVAGSVRGFRPPRFVDDLAVAERLSGDATTDFGAPSVAPAADARPLDARELKRLVSILEASWAAFDRIVDDATGEELRKGPRGGGRDLDAIVDHVIGAEGSYVARLATPRPKTEGRDREEAAEEERAVVRQALSRAVAEGLPEKGPRGGSIWLPRYFVRRAAWHVLDHVWEIEDRITTLPS
jgi:DinB family protein